MSHCTVCGAASLEPHERGHLRCSKCGEVNWQRPLPVAGTLTVRDGRVLLVRRAQHVEAGAGLWSFPGGFVESGETLEEAALRETEEEAGVRPRLLGVVAHPHTTLDPPRIVTAFRAALDEGAEPQPGVEASEVAWFAPHEVPWPEIAFSSTESPVRRLIDEGMEAVPRPVLLARVDKHEQPHTPAHHCARCGGSLRAPADGEEGAAVCSACGAPRWENPAPVASMLALSRGQVLLARSGREPARWDLPQVEVDSIETAENAALRALRQVSGLGGTIERLAAVLSGPAHIAYVYLGVAEGAGSRATSGERGTSETRWFGVDVLESDECSPAAALVVRRAGEQGWIA